MSFTFGETVQLIHRTVTQDTYGNDVPTDQAPVSIPGAGWDPGTSTETVQGQDQVVTQPRFFLPAGTVVTATDAIRRPNGNTYEVMGEAGDYASPFTGWVPGVVVNVRRVRG